MPKRTTRAQLAQETLHILAVGKYQNSQGQMVHFDRELTAARNNSVLYRPDALETLFLARDQRLAQRQHTSTTFEVVNETTLESAQRLLLRTDARQTAALNFASAKHPGGGFLKGSQAQEESLARSSGLYLCLTRLKEMYDANHHFPSCLYTDHMIYSPDVPVFRDDDGNLLDRPYLLSILTAPAVNVGAVRKNEQHNIAKIEKVMIARMEILLSIAVVQQRETLILGAWGCGVFQNDPLDVARWFAQHLKGKGTFAHAFDRVVFAVLDHSADRSTIQPFQQYFS